MRKHPIIKVYLPDDFPLNAHAAVYRQVQQLRSNRDLEAGTRDPYRLFIGGWSAVAHRYRAAAQHGRDFTNILNRWGAAPKAAIRVRQEQTLHDFFANGLSCLESFAFASYQVGALLKPEQFPIDDEALRDVTHSNVRRRLERAWRGNEVSTVLADLDRDEKHTQWKLVRNIVTHRAIPSRLFSMGGTSKLTFAHVGGADLDLGADLMKNRLAWLSTQLNGLTVSLQMFLDKSIGAT